MKSEMKLKYAKTNDNGQEVLKNTGGLTPLPYQLPSFQGEEGLRRANNL